MDKGLIYNKRYCKNISKTQGSDGVGSIKCTLRKETKNDIAKFIDREFINEAIKEITIYIKQQIKFKLMIQILMKKIQIQSKLKR